MKNKTRKYLEFILILLLAYLCVIKKKFDITQLVEVTIIFICVDVLFYEAIKEYSNTKRKLIEKKHKNAQNNKEIMERCSIHESGHAIVASALLPQREITEISLIPDKTSDGHVKFSKDYSSETKEENFYDIAVLLGGRAAEEIIFQHFTTGSSTDLKRASKLAYRMINEWGMGNNNLTVLIDIPEFDSQLIQSNVDEVNELCKEAYKKAKETIFQNKAALLKLAEILKKKNVMKGSEIKRFMLDNDVYPESEET